MQYRSKCTLRKAPPIVPPPTTADIIGQHLRTWRRLRKISQTEAAKATGLTRARLSRMENGWPVHSDVLFRLLDLYGISERVEHAFDPANDPEVVRELIKRVDSRAEPPPTLQ